MSPSRSAARPPISSPSRPKPEELVLRERNERVTLNLSTKSLAFFRELGKKSHVPYQKLIRRLLDDYAR